MSINSPINCILVGMKLEKKILLLCSNQQNFEEIVWTYNHVKDQFVQGLSNSNTHALNDISDSFIIKNHDLLKSLEAINVILYQDSYEVVNPLGSAKGKHKTLTIYFTLGNLNPVTHYLWHEFLVLSDSEFRRGRAPNAYSEQLINAVNGWNWTKLFLIVGYVQIEGTTLYLVGSVCCSDSVEAQLPLAGAMVNLRLTLLGYHFPR